MAATNRRFCGVGIHSGGVNSSNRRRLASSSAVPIARPIGPASPISGTPNMVRPITSIAIRIDSNSASISVSCDQRCSICSTAPRMSST
ncbi:hypothetical protein OV079_39495 [Nannocystis pusilla]|uniref:Uncharacterized protein n=1 Tax=Nannocystis pusilla TaxID=889268 RepID=A0A9X3J0D2_9BACT|nr:hypothetical protein [Nannocystis pusilla]MCY1011547.1 hypothetical protein [Nannocystis pusilla]